MIFAYGLLDPTINGNRTTITYHSTTRRGSRIIPLQSYANPPADSKFDGLDSFDFRLANVSLVDHRRVSRILSFQYSLPPQSTTYHCKIPSSANENHRAEAGHRSMYSIERIRSWERILVSAQDAAGSRQRGHCASLADVRMRP